MNTDVFVTCAITGAGDTTAQSRHVPVTPAQIGDGLLDDPAMFQLSRGIVYGAPMTDIPFPGHGGRGWPFARWRSLARISHTVHP